MSANENSSFVIIDPSLPHQREILALVGLVMDAYKDSNFVGLIITDSYEHGRWLIQRLHDSVRWDEKSGIKLFREGVEVKGGGKVILGSFRNPSSLRGIRANKVLLMGDLGEFWYLIQSMRAEIEAVA